MAIKSHIIQGTALWAKILGAAPPGYDNGPAEWSIDVVLDEKGQKEFLKSGADKFYLKKTKDGETFVRFTRKEVKRDGTKAKPISVIAADGSEWNQDRKIGNGSVINVAFTLNTVKSQGKERLKPSILQLQVWDLVEYKPATTFPTKPVSFSDETTEEEFPF